MPCAESSVPSFGNHWLGCNAVVNSYQLGNANRVRISNLSMGCSQQTALDIGQGLWNDFWGVTYPRAL